MTQESNRVAIVVVTYNRKALLERCLSALTFQTIKSVQTIVVDNASTDGTREFLQSEEWLAQSDFKLLALNDNLGGAGGFSLGLEQAIRMGADWIWMMDDDAAPHPDALAQLMQIATNPGDIYGSLAITGEETSWPMTLLHELPLTTTLAADIPPLAEVRMLPFLGFLVHRELVAKIGLPDPGFFIAADDVEYCVRAQKAGARIFVAGRSHIEHPKSRPYEVKLPGCALTALELPPWKRYYDTRNRILIARKYYGGRLFTQTIPGTLIRMVAALIREPHKLAQLRAFCAGFIDGLLGRKGRRHQKWGIK